MSHEGRFLPLTVPTLARGAADADGARARARGHAAGFAAGMREAREAARREAARRAEEQLAALEQAEARVGHQVAALECAARALHARSLPLVAEAEEVLANGSIELAEAILGHELDRDDLGARAALGRVLGIPGLPLDATVRMNPADLERLDDGLMGRVPVTLVADPEVAPGDAVADFPDGSLDARIGSALARAKAALSGVES